MKERTMVPRDRFRACLVGVAVGDALGGPFEGMSRDEVKRKFNGKMVGGGIHRLRAGECTDDASMTLALAESIIERGGVELDDIASKFVKWYASGPKGVGKLTAEVIGLLSSGVSYRDAARLAWERGGKKGAGNGSLMRFAPAGLLHNKRRERLICDAAAVSSLTHHDPRCTQACQAASLILIELIDGKDVKHAISSTATAMGEVEASNVMLRSLDATADELESTGYVMDTLGVACWSLSHHDAFRECVEACVLLGDDTDTSAAVTGALAGARFGLDGIPKDWVHALEMSEHGLGHIVELADGLYELSLSLSRHSH
jgi:ADP-ribosyl-[dinitrogen reductase] hydrolase